MLLHYAFADCPEGVYIRTRLDGKLFNIARLRAKTKTLKVLIRELLFADDAALASHSEAGLQRLVDKLSHACKEFGLTITLKKTNILAQDAETPPVITINNTEPEVVDSFTYLGSTVSSKASLDVEISSRIAKAAGVMAKLNKRGWINDLLSERTKLQVYRSCVLSTFLYGSESWPTYARQEKRLNGFLLRCLRRLLQIKWQDRVSNTNVLQRADMPSIPTLLIQRRLRWLVHVHRMEPDRLPRQVLYVELWEGARRVGRPLLRFKDVSKRDLRLAEFNPNTWEVLAQDRAAWRHDVKEGALRAETKARAEATIKRAARKERQVSVREATNYICTSCNRLPLKNRAFESLKSLLTLMR